MLSHVWSGPILILLAASDIRFDGFEQLALIALKTQQKSSTPDHISNSHIYSNQQSIEGVGSIQVMMWCNVRQQVMKWCNVRRHIMMCCYVKHISLAVHLLLQFAPAGFFLQKLSSYLTDFLMGLRQNHDSPGCLYGET